MSGKNRAFALAVATAALVGLSAPVAGAATLQDGPGGFNGDSILNLSNNQLPVQICSIAMPVNEILAQVPLTALSLVVNGTLNSTNLTPTGNQTCDQTSSQANPTTTNTNSSNTFTPSMHSGDRHTFWRGPARWHRAEEDAARGDSGPSGFNGDSILNLSNNQLPSQVCTAALPVNMLGFQEPVSILTAVLGTGTGASSLNSTTLDPVLTQGCTQTTSQTNDTTTNTNSNNTHS